jgi:hypothetical protein
VDATWGTLAHKNGRIFATYYNAGQAYEPCGANANGWQMFQWGSQACGLDGRSAAQILGIYYPGVTVSAAPPPSTPAPTPTPTPAPAPTAAPMPTPAPTPPPSPPPGSAAPTPTVAPTAAPTAPPATPAPTPAPVPAAPAPQPGGGQAGLSAPPPPPPPDPEPIIVSIADAGPIEVTAASPPERLTGARVDHARLFVDEAAYAWPRPSATPTPVASTRWVTFRALLGQLVARFAERLSAGGPIAQQPAGDQLGGGDVLDSEADRLEDGDGAGITRLDPVPADRPELHQLRLGQ